MLGIRWLTLNVWAFYDLFSGVGEKGTLIEIKTAVFIA
jgi:hypothetical protein